MRRETAVHFKKTEDGDVLVDENGSHLVNLGGGGGSAGPQGEPGPPGADGAEGPPGADGAEGPPGADGAPAEGALLWQGVYQDTEYPAGSVVKYGTHLYIATEDIAPSDLVLPPSPYTGPVAIYAGPNTPIFADATVHDGNTIYNASGGTVPVAVLFVRVLVGGLMNIVPSNFVDDGNGLSAAWSTRRIESDGTTLTDNQGSWSGLSTYGNFGPFDSARDYYIFVYDTGSPKAGFTGEITLEPQGACTIYTGPTPVTEPGWEQMI